MGWNPLKTAKKVVSAPFKPFHKGKGKGDGFKKTPSFDFNPQLLDEPEANQLAGEHIFEQDTFKKVLADRRKRKMLPTLLTGPQGPLAEASVSKKVLLGL